MVIYAGQTEPFLIEELDRLRDRSGDLRGVDVVAINADGVSLRRARVTGAPIYARSPDGSSSGSAPPPSSRG